jgi:hypothetical protein
MNIHWMYFPVRMEPSLAKAKFDERYHLFARIFHLDKDTSASRLVFNRTVSLKDAWAKEVKKNEMCNRCLCPQAFSERVVTYHEGTNKGFCCCLS